MSTLDAKQKLPLHRPQEVKRLVPEVAAVPSLLPPPKQPHAAEDLRVGDLARLTGKTVRALHLYEELGLLEPAHRSKGNFRLYRSDSVTRVHWISRLQEMDFSLPEIRDLLRDWDTSISAPDAMQRIHALYRRKQEETRLQVEKLHGLLQELGESIAYLETCHTCETERAVAACTACDRRECDSHTPVLVAGFHRH